MLTEDSMHLMIEVMSNDTFVGSCAFRTGEEVKLHILSAIFTTLRVKARQY
jgi:hypothetical protein